MLHPDPTARGLKGRTVSSEASTTTDIFDTESLAEVARRLSQDLFLTAQLGGPFPERSIRSRLSSMQSILDLGCGPGGWALEVARKYPALEVVGVDRSAKMIARARERAWALGLTNARFEVMDSLDLHSGFEDGYFDLINGRLLFSFMRWQDWPRLLEECRRITRTTGILRLTEGEWYISSSPAFERYETLCLAALRQAGRTFSTRELGITAALRPLMTAAGYGAIRQRSAVIDYSADTAAHPSLVEDSRVAFQLIQPFLLSTGVATREEIALGYQQASEEMNRGDFHAVQFLLTVWGEVLHP